MAEPKQREPAGAIPRARGSGSVPIVPAGLVSDAEIPLWEFIADDLPRVRAALRVAVAMVAVLVLAFSLRDWQVAPDVAPFTTALRGLVAAVGVWTYRGLGGSDQQVYRRAMTFAYAFLFVDGLVISLLPHGFVYYATPLLLTPLAASMFLPRAIEVVRLQGCVVIAVHLGLLWRRPPIAELAAMEVALLVASVITIVLGTMGVRSRHRQVRLERKLRDEAERDALTGAFNRRYLWAIGTTEIQRCRRYHRRLALLAIDLDNFKQVNDVHGHEAGDQVIRTTAAILQARIRECDVLARVGGEEFVVLLPETGVPAAAVLAERLRLALASARFTTAVGELAWTGSIGVTELADGDGQLEDLLRRADRALYQAKDAGRDRVVVLAAEGGSPAPGPVVASGPVA